MKAWKHVAAATAAALLVIPVFSPGEQAASRREVAIDDSSLRTNSLPFSLERVLNYFTEAFDKRPSKIDGKSFVFIDRANPDEIAIITVSDLDESLAVVLLATGDYGVNYLREFFEAPFFSRRESEELYGLLDRGPGIHSTTFRRFSVRMGIQDAGSWLVVALKFLPSRLYGAVAMPSRNSAARGSPEHANFRKTNGNNREAAGLPAVKLFQ